MSAGIVGPLGSSSFSLPNVERALSEMESGMGPAGASAAAGSRIGQRPPAVSARSGGLGGASPPTSAGRVPTSPTPGLGATSPATGQSQHEVLQNFFQSLLNTKDRTGATPARSATPRVNGTSPPGAAPNGSADEEN